MYLLHSKDDETAVFIDHDTRIQVLDTMALLARADKEQCAAFIVSLSKSSLAYLTDPTFLPGDSATSAF